MWNNRKVLENMIETRSNDFGQNIVVDTLWVDPLSITYVLLVGIAVGRVIFAISSFESQSFEPSSYD